MGHYGPFGTMDSAQAIASDLRKFISQRETMNSNFTTFIAIFDSPISMDEKHFETLLWKQLSELHQLDTQPWSPVVSSNPNNKEFGFSFDSTAFFIIGLHANSSRLARRFSNPTLVFNSHSQFNILKETGKYQKMQKVIRDRDKALQGTINPMAADFGTISEARQYSGRQVSSGWKCPFSVKAFNND